MERDIYRELGILRALADIGARTIAELLDEDASDFRKEWNRESARINLEFIRKQLAEIDSAEAVDKSAA